MLRGFYNAAAGMIAEQRRQEMLSNNIANVNTPGFKADQGSLRTFPKMLLQQMSSSQTPDGNITTSFPIGELATGVYLQETVPKFLQGDLKETGLKTDIALAEGTVPVNRQTGKRGALFFIVQNEEGQLRLTRNGHFTVDPAGTLVTAEGYKVMGKNGKPIKVADENFKVEPDGTIINQGKASGQIDIAYIDDPFKLMKEGNGLYRLEGNGPIASAIGNRNVAYQLKQGFIERSNVDMDRTMTEMMTAYRAFEANQKVLQAYDRSMDKAVNEVGKIG
ncbi:flagellar hook-basal body protein [Fictibacillus sp. Mic-4]|uniref:flagellar hook-basal body protein n=1 Tax=Fictibacillus sp. Mic-4 TaxID=3132826 RepID=UPI003CF4B3C6